MSDGDNGAAFMLEENKRRMFGRALGWSDAEIRSYHSNKPVWVGWDLAKPGSDMTVYPSNNTSGKDNG